MTNGYLNAFITLAPDCPVSVGTVPACATSIAGLEYDLLAERPYWYTTAALLLEVHRRHKHVADQDLDLFRAALFARSHPCMRVSMLAKRWGWGIHFDGHGRIALYGAETVDYSRLGNRADLRIMAARQSRRGIRIRSPSA